MIEDISQKYLVPQTPEELITQLKEGSVATYIQLLGDDSLIFDFSEGDSPLYRR
jgi:hypothetical protein